MEFRLTPELESFRQEARAFLADAMAPERTRGCEDPLDLTGWSEEFERALSLRAGERGYLGPHVPTEYGGGGRPLSYKAVFGFETAYWNAPLVDTAITLAGTPLLAFGSEAQKRELLPAMCRGELLMSIAYSEADAGSDLTRIATRARRDGDGFVLDGCKAHVTGLHKSDYACLVARTDPDAVPRRGMSMFLVDLGGPGIRIERRATMNRWTLGELHLEGARVGANALLGEWNRGWSQMASALLSERSGLFHVGWAVRRFEQLWEHGSGADARVRSRLVDLRAQVATAVRFATRVMREQDAGDVPVEHASMSKVYATELLQRLAHAALEILGPEAALYPGSPRAPMGGAFAWELLERIHPTISVGANELQRDTIARAALELPRG